MSDRAATLVLLAATSAITGGAYLVGGSQLCGAALMVIGALAALITLSVLRSPRQLRLPRPDRHHRDTRNLPPYNPFPARDEPDNEPASEHILNSAVTYD